MSNIQEKINELLKNIEENPSKIKDILEATVIKNLPSNLRIKYFEWEKILLELKKELEVIPGKKLIGQFLRESLEQKQDKFLNLEQELVKNNTFFVGEKQAFIINILKRLETQNFNKFEMWLQEYLVSNLYRTYCEISIKNFTDNLLVITNYNLSKKDQKKSYMNDQKKNKEKILLGTLSLEGFKKILERFEEDLEKELGFSKLFEEIFLYKKKEGFSLRNDIAHEKLSFSNIKVNFILDEIHKVNIFNQLVIKIFYLDAIGNQFKSKDLEYSKKLFGKE